MNLSQKGISIGNEDFLEVASEIQGNILKSHGRNLVSIIFFRFNGGEKDAAKKFIRTFAKSRNITSAAKQIEDSKAYKKNKRQQRKFVSFFLSAKGYDFLKIDEEKKPSDPQFRAGMSGSQNGLKDPFLGELEKSFQEECHGIILVARSSKSGKRGNLNRTLNSYVSKLQLHNLATILNIEEGQGNKNKNDDDIEHFGYVDGISQPRFFHEDIDKIIQNKDGVSNWNPLMPASLVLVDDPGSVAPNSFGSYFVFRKLEQNVKGFRTAEEELAKDLFGQSVTKEQIDLAGALMMGRFKNGMPVTMSEKDNILKGAPVNLKEVGKLNNFNYSDDNEGAKCPFHAHTRKTNPREEGDKQRMMARRGIPYGQRNKDFSDRPEGNVGLLFMSYQKDISFQFEFIQKLWANNDNFPKRNIGKDPVIGQGGIRPKSQSYARNYGDGTTISSSKSFGDFVTHRGGEYFFAPSLDFLKNL